MTSDPDLWARLRASATQLSAYFGGAGPASEAVHLMRMAADFVESAETAERERLEHEAVTGGNDGGVLAQVGSLIDAVEAEWDDDTGPQAQGVRLGLARLRDNLRLRFATGSHRPLDPPMVSDELRSKLAAEVQHKLELNRRGWDYDEARDGFVRVVLQPLSADATDIPPDPLPWPLAPMREQYDSDEAYTRAMVAWGKTVHEIERSRET